MEKEAKKIGSEIMKSVEEMKANGNVLVVSPALKVTEKNGKQEEPAAVPGKKAKNKMKEADELKRKLSNARLNCKNAWPSWNEKETFGKSGAVY